MTNDKQRERLVELLMSKSCHYNKCPDVPCNRCEYIAAFLKNGLQSVDN